MRSADPAEIAQEVRARAAGRHLLVLCDFDGTLCEFDPDPEAVWLPPHARVALEAIAARTDATVGLVSGRRLDDVRRRAYIGDGAYYAGLHGLEIQGEDGRFTHPDADEARDLIRSITAAMRPELNLDGVFLEDKDLSVVAHYRAAPPEAQARVQEVFERHARPHLESGRLRVMAGSCARELLPNIDWNKGAAVAWIADRIEGRYGSAWTLYLGDDVTDEDAFRVVRHRGLGVAASDRVTEAAYKVEGPAGVQTLLGALG